MFCPTCGTWNRTKAVNCLRCKCNLPELREIPREPPDPEISLVRKSIDWFLVSGEDEAFYLRVYSAGDYRYYGADMGVLVSRGRFQTDQRQLNERAKRWVAAIHRQFSAIPVSGSSAPVAPPAHDANKMF